MVRRAVNFGLRFWLFFFFFFLIFSNGKVFAIELPKDNLNMYGQNNIVFYDPTESICDTSTMNYSSKPSGSQITWIGDSYSVGAKSVIDSKLSGVDYGVGVDMSSSYIQVSKFVASGDSGNPSGFTILRELVEQNRLRPYLVFALGTNGGWTESSMNEFLGIVNSTDTKVVLVTSKTPKDDYASSNEILKTAASENSNIYLADWTAVYKDEFFNNDPGKIHPTANGGYEAWVNAIYDALPGGSVGLVAGSNNKEKIWNWFVQANIPGVSDNPAVIAGILGNLQMESGFNPFSHTNGSSYYGLYQSNNQDLINKVKNTVGDYWGRTDVPQDANDKAIQIELEYLISSEYNWNGSNFLEKINVPTHQSGTSGAEAYADLFLCKVERASTDGSTSLKDDGVRGECYRGKESHWQAANKRRENAVNIYNELAGGSVTSVATAAEPSSVTWNDGWLSGFIGLTREDANGFANENALSEYSTGKPNKILLHNTEGVSNGRSAYPSGAAYPAHFTIDLKKKVVSQHYSINQPAVALKSVDADGAIQIEIVGFSTETNVGDGYYLPSFTATEWDYLAALLLEISKETGIPLTTSVDWGDPMRMTTREEFKNYSGVLGHMHAPLNDHVDPGDIWSQLEAAIARNPSSGQFAANGAGGFCDVFSYGGNIPLTEGGMTLEQGLALMDKYWSLPDNSNMLNGAAVSSCRDKNGSNLSYLGNCVNFSKYFVHEYTTLNPSTWTLGNGIKFAPNLASDQGLRQGSIPEVYSIFSGGGTGEEGHTGVVLGIKGNKILIAEAGCYGWGSGNERYRVGNRYRAQVSWELLSDYTSGGYKYAYLDGYLKL